MDNVLKFAPRVSGAPTLHTNGERIDVADVIPGNVAHFKYRREAPTDGAVCSAHVWRVVVRIFGLPKHRDEALTVRALTCDEAAVRALGRIRKAQETEGRTYLPALSVQQVECVS